MNGIALISVNLWFHGGIKTRSHGHHHLKLLETDLSIPIWIHPAYHFPAFRQCAFFSQAHQHILQLLRWDRSVFIDIKHLERVPQVLQDLGMIDVLGVQLDEFLQIDEPVPVRIHLADHGVQFLLRGGVAKAAHYRTQLGRGDLAVSIDVEFLENLLQLLLDPDTGTQRRWSGVYGFDIHRREWQSFRTTAALFLLPIEQWFKSHDQNRRKNEKWEKETMWGEERWNEENLYKWLLWIARLTRQLIFRIYKKLFFVVIPCCADIS